MNQQKPKLERRIELAEVPKLTGAETMPYGSVKDFFLFYNGKTYIKRDEGYDPHTKKPIIYYKLLN